MKKDIPCDTCNSPSSVAAVTQPAVTRYVLKYDRFVKAPDKHKKVIRAYITGRFPDAQICYAYKMHPDEFQAVISHPPNVEFIIRASTLVLEEQTKIFQWHQKLAPKFLQVYADVAFDKKQKGADRVRAASEALNRHPSREFSPHTRASVTVEDETKDAVNVLRQRYLEEKQREKRQAEAIPVEGEPS